MFQSLNIEWLIRCDRWHFDYVYFTDGQVLQHFDQLYRGHWAAADYHYDQGAKP